MTDSKDTNPKDAVGTKKWRQYMAAPRQVLWEVGVAMLEGALKYGRHNYRASGVRASVYLDAAYGHLDQFAEGEDIDSDSGMSHVTKAIASLVVLRDAMMNDFWVDDRPPTIHDIDGVRDRLQKKVEEIFARYGDVDPHHYTIDDPAAYPVFSTTRRATIGKDFPTGAVLEIDEDALRELREGVGIEAVVDKLRS